MEFLRDVALAFFTIIISSHSIGYAGCAYVPHAYVDLKDCQEFAKHGEWLPNEDKGFVLCEGTKPLEPPQCPAGLARLGLITDDGKKSGAVICVDNSVCAKGDASSKKWVEVKAYVYCAGSKMASNYENLKPTACSCDSSPAKSPRYAPGSIFTYGQDFGTFHSVKSSARVRA